mmetsp:Transcript_10350/g.19043  ORF Transcript_10350/g.19043 Transcript_10350/m.19043 type:complete len:146 (-) Transcript_10350:79-516(-)
MGFDKVEGQCYCGAIEYTVKVVDPEEEGDHKTSSCFCYCENCKRAHASPLYHVVHTAGENFDIVKGEELLNKFEGRGVTRHFCSTCGSRVFNTNPSSTGVGFFPATLKTEYQQDLPKQFKPTYVYCPQERTLDLDLLVDLSNKKK